MANEYRASWNGVEVLRSTDLVIKPKVTWIGTEVLRSPNVVTYPRVSWMGVEVLEVSPVIVTYAGDIDIIWG